METTQEINAEGLALVHVLATVLDRLCIANAPMALADPGLVTKFHAMKTPGIGILQYLERIHKNNFLLTDLNVHRVVITAVLLAAKFFDDAYYNNAYYAKVGGVLVSEMNGLEVDFLFRINFSLHVTPEMFDKYRVELLTQAAACAPVLQQLAAVVPSPSLQHTPAPGPQVICNPQSATNHNFSMPIQTMNDNPFVNCHASQITPPPVLTPMMACNYNIVQGTDPLLNFPIHFADGFTQVQKAHSFSAYRTYHPAISVTCGMDPPYASAPPAIITPAMHYPPSFATSVNVAAVMEQQIFPLRNSLVHHNHTGHVYAIQTIQPKADRRGAPRMLAGGVL